MNEPLPGKVSAPLPDDIVEKDIVQEDLATEPQALATRAEARVDSAPPAESDERPAADQDDDEDHEVDEDEDDEDRARRAAARAPAPPPAVPVRFADVISGQFDVQAESAEAEPPKRVLLPQVDTPKLHKVLAQAGLGSRLEMEQLITAGRI
jgi:23S rRNA pseudouridine2605 synthase